MRSATPKSTEPLPGRFGVWLLAVAVCLGSVVAAVSEEAVPREQVAHDAYQQAKEDFDPAKDDPDPAWQFARACFDWAEFSSNHTQRAELAREGIAACERALRLDPGRAGAYYYLGMNQGQLARTMSLGALKLVQRMESHFFKARELDPTFDHAGPDRNLGLLYLNAPGWPVSVGNRSKAEVHLSKAVELAPDYPENRLNLMEAFVRWDDPDAVRRELRAWAKHVEAARRKFSGERWRWDWQNWERRLAEVRRTLTEQRGDRESPKTQG